MIPPAVPAVSMFFTGSRVVPQLFGAASKQKSLAALASSPFASATKYGALVGQYTVPAAASAVQPVKVDFKRSE
jgi:hypothetical protein